MLRFDYERRSWRAARAAARRACACELLSESADWNGPTHDTTPDAASRLAETLASLAEAALDLAAAKQSGLANHPTLGLVSLLPRDRNWPSR